MVEALVVSRMTCYTHEYVAVALLHSTVYYGLTVPCLETDCLVGMEEDRCGDRAVPIGIAVLENGVICL
eukprot:14852307-Ditylum_brightwellii.AAC.1